MNTKEKALNIWKNFLIERKWYYVIGIFSVIMTNLMQVSSPKIIGIIVDFLSYGLIPNFLKGKDQMGSLWNLFLLTFFSKIILNFFRFLWRITLARQTHHACVMLREKIWEEVSYFNLSDFREKFSKGSIVNASASEALSARSVFGFSIIGIVDTFFLGLFCFLQMASIHLPMTLFSFFILLFIPFLAKKNSELELLQFKKTQSALSEFNNNSAIAVASIKMQRLTQSEKFWNDKLLKTANIHRQEKLKGQMLALNYLPIMGSASLISYIILFAVGIYLTMNNKMGLGDFVAMQGSIFLLHDPLLDLGFIFSDWRKCFAALTRLTELFDHKKDPDLQNSLKEEIIFEDLSDSILNVEDLTCLNEKGEVLFKPISFQLKSGEKIGITGPIGIGKSFLMMVLQGLERNHFKGILKIFNKSYEELNHFELRKLISFVSQKNFLFAESIFFNMKLDSSLTEQEIENFLKIVELDKEIENLPNGIHTKLGEWGVNLSGGQKQRLSLARALAKKPKVLFLDDCLSAVDTVTEEKILENLKDFCKDLTIVWVAHRQSTLRYCDFQISLEKYPLGLSI